MASSKYTKTKVKKDQAQSRREDIIFLLNPISYPLEILDYQEPL